MPVVPKRFGTDLRLLRNLDLVKSNRDKGSDLATIARAARRLSPAGALIANVDLDLLTGADNLVQALFLRFLTPMGELTALGHPNYGSRLADLIGELNNETNRNRAKLFVLEALGAEPRIKEVRSVIVSQNKSDRTRVDINLSLTTIDTDTPLNLVFPFFLEGGPTS
jgi:phage baseplate assembly protein W